MLSLDTPGYNQGTSGLDALWAGAPLVTLPLRQWCERMGHSLVRHGGAGGAGAAVHSLRAMEDLIALLVQRERRAPWRGRPWRAPVPLQVSGVRR